MNGNKIKIIALLTALVLYAVVAVCTLVGWNNVLSSCLIRKLLFRPMKIGAIYIDPENAEYSIVHDDALDAASARIGKGKVKIVKRANVPADSDVIGLMEDMINGGCELIFADAVDYQDYVLSVAEKYPDVYFAVAAGEKTAPNVSCYWGRTYQLRYLTGILTGLMVKSGSVGYVAGYKIPQVIRDVDAFTLGVRSVNKEVVVKVIWVDTWSDALICKKAALALLGQGAELIIQHVDSMDPAIVAVQHGKYAIGHNADFGKSLGSPNILVSLVWNWEPFMVSTIRSVLDGKWQSQFYWGGIKEGMISLTNFSPLVRQEVRDRVTQAAEAIVNHDDVFCGELRDNRGNIRQRSGVCMSDQQLLTIDWLVEGVEEVPLI